MGAAVRLQRLIGGDPKTTVSGRGSLQVRLGRLTAHGYFEAGNDVTNRTLFATNAFSSSVVGLSANLSRSWSLDVEAFRNRLVTELNPENIFLLQNQGGFISGALAAFNQWSFYFRLAKQFSWGRAIRSANIYQYTVSQVTLVGSVDGFVWERRTGEMKPAAGITVKLDESRVAQTEADGRFHFAEVAEGQHRVALALDELPANYDPGTVREMAVVIQPKRIARADLEVVRLTSIQGRIVGPGGISLENIVVRLLPTERYTTPDREGNFSFQNLREGQYTVVLDEKTLPQNGFVLTTARIPVRVRLESEPEPIRFQFDVRSPDKPVRKVFEGRAPGL